MSMVFLTIFDEAMYKPSKRRTKCKNCDDWSGDVPVQTPIPAGHPRIVVKGNWGPSTRHLTLCVECAIFQADKLQALVDQIRQAVPK